MATKTDRKKEWKLIIGLGNPDSKYLLTYHNAGFLAADYFKENPEILNAKRILKSDVYMNESGRFVKSALKKNNAKPEELLIIHDDSDIELGEYKLSFGRNSAGHKGAESVINALGTKNFWRLRIGIRPKIKTGLPARARRAKAGDFVLKKINKKDLEALENTFNKAASEIQI